MISDPQLLRHATKQVDNFRKYYGVHCYYLALHASCPLALTPHLLYQMLDNFQKDVHGISYTILWTAVGDLLLSELCREVSLEIYEFAEGVRDVLSERLLAHNRFGKIRERQLAQFLHAYTAQFGTGLPHQQKFLQVQRWASDAVLNPEHAVTTLAQNYQRQLEIGDQAGQLQFPSLMNALRGPLKELESFGLLEQLSLAHYEGLVGQTKRSSQQINDLFKDKTDIEVAGVRFQKTQIKSSTTIPSSPFTRAPRGTGYRVFISYRRTDWSKALSHRIYEELRSRDYEIFLDTTDLKVGTSFSQQIYDEIRQSHVLLVICMKETEQSEWVRREIDFARGAGVSILPVEADPAMDISTTIGKLALEDIQWLRLDPQTPDIDEIALTINQLAPTTRPNQIRRLEQQLSSSDRKPLSSNPSYAVFRMNGNFDLHIGTGRIDQLRNVDIIVNPTNNFLQLPHVFEPGSLAASLRYLGAYISDSGHLTEDTVQDILDTVSSSDVSPIKLGAVISTVAGHPASELRRKTRCRYLMHVITQEVRVSRSENIVWVFKKPSEVVEATTNCLREILAIDKRRGARLEDSRFTPQYQNYIPVKSIAFPILTATGQFSQAEVIAAMGQAIAEWNPESFDSNLREIYLMVSFKDELDAAMEMARNWSRGRVN